MELNSITLFYVSIQQLVEKWVNNKVLITIPGRLLDDNNRVEVELAEIK